MPLKKRSISTQRADTIAFWCCFPCNFLIAVVCCLPSCGRSCELIVPSEHPTRMYAVIIADEICCTYSIDSIVFDGDSERNKALNKLKSLGIENGWNPNKNFEFGVPSFSFMRRSFGQLKNSNLPKIKHPMEQYHSDLVEKIFNILDEHDVGNLRSDGYIDMKNLKFIGAELQKALFFALPDAANFHRDAKGNTDSDYLDQMLARTLKSITTDKFLIAELNKAIDALECNQNKKILDANRKIDFFSQANKDFDEKSSGPAFTSRITP